MPVRDHAPWVGEMLDSVLGQTHERLEIVLVECGSTDGTAEIVSEYQRRDPQRMRALFLDHDPGFCSARNLAFSLTRGSLLCWMDSDDIWAADKVAKQAELLEARPEVGLVYSHFEAFDDATGEVLDWEVARTDLEGDLLAPLFTEGCIIASQTTMFRRQAVEAELQAAGRGETSFLDDYELWMRIAMDWRVARIPEVLMRYRRHDRNLSSRLSDGQDPWLMLAGMQRHLIRREPRVRAALGDVRFRARAGFLERAAQNEASALRARGLRLRAAANRLAASVTRPPAERQLRIAAPSTAPRPA